MESLKRSKGAPCQKGQGLIFNMTPNQFNQPETQCQLRKSLKWAY